MDALRAANLAARFLLELCALSALGYWGYDTGGAALAVGAPLLGAVVWVSFVSPRAWIPAPAAARFGFELLVFVAAVAGLIAGGQRALALALGVAYAVNRALIELIGEPAVPTRD